MNPMVTHWEFEFSVNEDWLLVFVTSDITDSLLFDFSVMDNRKQCMRIER